MHKHVCMCIFCAVQCVLVHDDAGATMMAGGNGLGDDTQNGVVLAQCCVVVAAACKYCGIDVWQGR